MIDYIMQFGSRTNHPIHVPRAKVPTNNNSKHIDVIVQIMLWNAFIYENGC